jgi:metallo-beta-lactamase class B
MRSPLLLLFLALLTCTGFHCSSHAPKPFAPKVVYQSPTLVITQLAAHSFQHTSYKQTNDFGNVPCNGLVVRNGGETVVFDTPTNDSCATELLQWIVDSLRCRVTAVIPTHFHDDCLGGLKAFQEQGIPSYAHFKTIELAQANNYTVPVNGFRDSLKLPVGKESVQIRFFGEGHTRDNVVGYFAADRILFGGCLLKEMNASKGYLGDANVAAWSNTVARVKQAFPAVQQVVPGHGASGGPELLDYTIGLFSTR